MAEKGVVLLELLGPDLADALLLLGEALLADFGEPGFDLLQLVREFSQLELLRGKTHAVYWVVFLFLVLVVVIVSEFFSQTLLLLFLVVGLVVFVLLPVTSHSLQSFLVLLIGIEGVIVIALVEVVVGAEVGLIGVVRPAVSLVFVYDVHLASSEGGIIPVVVDLEAIVFVFAFLIRRHKLRFSQAPAAVHAIDVPLGLNKGVAIPAAIEQLLELIIVQLLLATAA